MSPRATSRVRTNKGKGCNQPRRFWTFKEEEFLVQILESLHASGMKLDGSLTGGGGYVTRVVNLMEEKLPGCGIEVTHVRSKIQVWRKTHHACLIILSASGASGFGFDTNTKMFVAEKPEAWEEHAKVHPDGVKLLKGKSFPWLEKWNTLFGTDKATENYAVDVVDAMNDMTSSNKFDSDMHNLFFGNENMQTKSSIPIDIGSENEGEQSVTPDEAECSAAKKKYKRRRTKHDDDNEIKSLLTEIMAGTRGAIGDVAESLKQGQKKDSTPAGDDDPRKAGLYDTLSVLPGLSFDDIMWSVVHLANNRNDIIAYYGMPFEVRAAFVVTLMRNAGRIK